MHSAGLQGIIAQASSRVLRPNQLESLIDRFQRQREASMREPLAAESDLTSSSILSTLSNMCTRIIKLLVSTWKKRTTPHVG